jgi:hypothetical protein
MNDFDKPNTSVYYIRIPTWVQVQNILEGFIDVNFILRYHEGERYLKSKLSAEDCVKELEKVRYAVVMYTFVESVHQQLLRRNVYAGVQGSHRNTSG